MAFSNVEKGESIMALLNVNNLQKVYTTRLGGAKVQALSGVSFTVEEGNLWPSWVSPVPARPPCSTSWPGWINPPAAKCF